MFLFCCRCGYAQPNENDIRSVLLPLCASEERHPVHDHYLPAEDLFFDVKKFSNIEVRFKLLRPLSVWSIKAHISGDRLSLRVPEWARFDSAGVDFVPEGEDIRCMLRVGREECICRYEDWHKSPRLELLAVASGQMEGDDAHIDRVVTVRLPLACTAERTAVGTLISSRARLPEYWRHPQHLELPMALYRHDTEAFQSIWLFDRRTNKTVCTVL